MFQSVLEKKKPRGPRFATAAAAVFALAQAAAADVVEQGVKDSKPSGLLAGVAKVNIEPAIGIPHQNWGSATHIVASGIDPAGMFIRALVLSDGKTEIRTGRRGRGRRRRDG